MASPRKVSVVGLGYVGLPVAIAFARHGSVIAFDVDEARIAELRSGRDRTLEAEKKDLTLSGLRFTSNAADLSQADFHVVTVPTPVDGSKRPDLRALESASATVGTRLKRGDIVIYESTVYPGVTEGVCLPLLEKSSGLKPGRDFGVGYSPERINPGDQEHRFENIAKVVAGQDARTLEIIADTYGRVVRGAIHRAPSIMVAEAAKVIENTQRDVNIALVNEFALIFQRLGIDTQDVLQLAGTKWNFNRFQPGLVGGHCIGVDPFYLTHLAEQAGYRPEVILSGRRINDSMPVVVAQETVKRLLRRPSKYRAGRVTILGLSFKENVPDVRNSRVMDIVKELNTYGFSVQVHDPLVDSDYVRRNFGLEVLPLERLEPADAVILAVAHRPFVEAGWTLITRLLSKPGGLVMDVKGVLDRSSRPEDVQLWRL